MGTILALYVLQLRPLLGQQRFQFCPLGLQPFQCFLCLGALPALGCCLGDGLLQLGELGGSRLLAAFQCLGQRCFVGIIQQLCALLFQVGLFRLELSSKRGQLGGQMGAVLVLFLRLLL